MSTSDRELLELAAKAAGLVFDDGRSLDPRHYMARPIGSVSHDDWRPWNPLYRDGDALRLAVKLGIKVTPYPIYESPKHSVLADRLSLSSPCGAVGPQVIEIYRDDPLSATRRAIVRAAAEIGKEAA